ncbi:MAG: peptidoglycan DD-metalloendopeptidase family protein [Candidatus Metalachnospira sp.]|nr:peptidoglycan DD-metalloendopeptidase family protein [Candidatus Metalachnospira sp.]
MKKYFKYITAFVIMAALSISALPHISAEAKTLSELQNERSQLSKETQSAKDKLAEARQKQADVMAEIKAMDDVVNAAQNELDGAQAELDDVNNRLAESQAALEAATIKREEQFKTFAQRMKYFYENSQISYLDIILSAQDFGDMIRRLQYMDDIMSYDNNMLTELTETQNEISKRTEEIKDEKEQAEYLCTVAQEKMDNLNDIVAQKEALVTSYAQDEDKYNQLIESNEKASQDAQALINKLLAESSSNKSTFVYTGGILNWPIPSRSASPSSISSGYGTRVRPKGTGTEFHTGYDIPASYGSAVVAAEAGTVIYAGLMNGYGNTVMINHGNGLVTLYGHNSSLTVSKGDVVSRGEQIAKVGSTGNSTGNHCHFEVRANGGHVNPEAYLGVPNPGA